VAVGLIEADHSADRLGSGQQSVLADQQHGVVDLVDPDLLQRPVDVVRVGQGDVEVGLRVGAAGLLLDAHVRLGKAEVGWSQWMAGGLQRQGRDVGLTDLPDEDMVTVVHRSGQPHLGCALA
jgi:hypothetical protein